MTYTLITGATGVLGGAFCRLAAKDGRNLFLTGRNVTELEELKNALIEEYPSINVLVYPCDLSSDASRAEFFGYAGRYRFSQLFNVAGADIQKPFDEYDSEKIAFQIRACFEGAVVFCNFAIRHMSDKLQIINISSVSGMQPMPYFAVYSASKSALTNFTVALNAEMKNKGVTATAVIAGAIYTRPDVIEYIKTQGLWGRIAAKTPEYVATKSLKAAAKRKPKYIAGGANRFLATLLKVVPEKIKLRAIARRWSKTRKDAF